MRHLLLTGGAVRLVLLLTGLWVDNNSVVPYTDVDYRVFCDAAAAVAAGGSPFDRATYRYTPLLAWVLLPTVWLNVWGKLLFCAGDLVVAYLTASVLRSSGASEATARLGAAVTLFNPFTAAVSTRGSCDSLLAVLTLLTLRAALQRRHCVCGAFLGCATHFRVFPIIHALPLGLWCLLGSGPHRGAKWHHRLAPPAAFSLSFVAAFLLLGGACYAAHGWAFVEQAYGYHVTRRDPRHNFSPWFLPAYLGHDAQHGSSGAAATVADPGWHPKLASALAAVAPQAACVFACGCLLWRDPAAALFFQTLLFVAFNRVITAQYFTWWMNLAPLLFPGFLATKTRRGPASLAAAAAAAALWLLTQLLWLATAARLEFGDPADVAGDAYAHVWLASLAFLASQALLAALLLRAYTRQDCAAATARGKAQ